MRMNWARTLSILFAGLLVSVFFFTQILAPWAIRNQLVSLAQKSCPNCTFDFERCSLSFSRFSVSIEGAHLIAGDRRDTEVDARAELLVVELSPGKLFSRQLYIRRLQIVAPQVTYVRSHQGLVAPLHVSDIEGTLTALGTIPELQAGTPSAAVKGRLERSGGFELKITTPLFQKDLSVDIDLKIAGQNLADLNPYFQNSEGIALKGSLDKGQSLVSIRGLKLTASVQAQYLGLDVHFEKSKERNAVAALLSNLVESLKVNSSNMGKSPADQIRMIKLVRNPDEALVHFVFRGMRDAALSVATAKNKHQMPLRRFGR